MSTGGRIGRFYDSREERRLLFEQFLRCIDREENLIHYRMSWGIQCNVALFAGVIALQAVNLKYRLGAYNIDIKVWAAIGIAMLGGAASVLASIGVRAAHTQTDYLKRELAKCLEISSDDDWGTTEFLRPYGEWTVHKAARKISAIIPLLFIGVWTIVFFWAFKQI